MVRATKHCLVWGPKCSNLLSQLRGLKSQAGFQIAGAPDTHPFKSGRTKKNKLQFVRCPNHVLHMKGGCLLHPELSLSSQLLHRTLSPGPPKLSTNAHHPPQRTTPRTKQERTNGMYEWHLAFPIGTPDRGCISLLSEVPALQVFCWLLDLKSMLQSVRREPISSETRILKAKYLKPWMQRVVADPLVDILGGSTLQPLWSVALYMQPNSILDIRRQ